MEYAFGLLALLVVAVVTVILFKGYFPVPQGHVVLIERFGQYQRLLQTGINFVFPLIDKPRDFSDWLGVGYKNRIYVELAEQHTDTRPRVAMTKDNVEVDIDASVYWQIIDPVRARYEVDRLPVALSDMALNVLRTAVGGLTLDQCLTERSKLNQHLLAQLTKSCDKWGTKVIRVEIQTLRPTAGGAGEALMKEMGAERERRATILRATGEKEAELLRASGDKEAMVMRAEGEAQATLIRAAADVDRLKKLTDCLGAQDGLRTALAWRYMDTLAVMAKDPALKVYLSNGYAQIPFSEAIAEFSNHDRRDMPADPTQPLHSVKTNWPPGVSRNA